MPKFDIVQPAVREWWDERLDVCPWSASPFGVVSLLDVLRYAAEDFITITKMLAALVVEPDNLRRIDVQKQFQDTLDLLSKHTYRFNLTLSRNQIERVVRTVNSADWEAVTRELNQLLLRIEEELKDRAFRYVDKVDYEVGLWLEGEPELLQDREVLPELMAAGRCYAYGENTACVFHLMRVVDYGLRLVATSLKIAYDARNWHGISNAIEKNMAQKYTDKSADWKQSEPFYAEILTDIQAIGRGHRNPVLHELEKKCDGREAQYMLAVTVGFIKHVLAHTGSQP